MNAQGERECVKGPHDYSSGTQMSRQYLFFFSHVFDIKRCDTSEDAVVRRAFVHLFSPLQVS